MDLDKLPFEDTVTGGLDRIAQRIQGSRVSQKLVEIRDKLPMLRERQIISPLGSVKLPEISLPAPTVPRLDPKKMEAVKAGLGKDLAYFPALVPVVGDYLAGVVEDTWDAKAREVTTPEEYARYQKYDKISPFSCVAMVRAFTSK